MRQQCRQQQPDQRQHHAAAVSPSPDSTPRKIVRNALPTKDWTLQADGQAKPASLNNNS
jgi:hypothetical protein